MRLLNLATVVTVLAVAIAAPALAGKGGNGHGGGGGAGGGGGSPTQSDPSCSVSANSVAVGDWFHVTASGLPTDSAINFWITDPNGHTVGTPLGTTPDGTADMSESASSSGPWTYTFSGPTRNNPATMAVYATCSVTAY